MKKILLFVFALIILAACSPKVPELTGISLNNKSISIESGESKQLVVIYEPEDAEAGADEIVWKSSATNIATVDEEGVVTGVYAGKATITATCGKFSAECEVNVVEEVFPLQGISLDPSTLKMEEGSTKKLTVKYLPISAEAGAPEVVWESSNPEFATVNKEGEITGVKEGESTITATCGEHSATCEVTIVKKRYMIIDCHDLDISADGIVKKITISGYSGERIVNVSSFASWARIKSVGESISSTATSFRLFEGESREYELVIDPSVDKDYTSTYYVFYLDGYGDIEDITDTIKVRRRPAKGNFFSVNANNKKVEFQRSNLKFQSDFFNIWQIDYDQTNYVGSNNKNISSTYKGWIDLFGWGTGNNPLLCTGNDADYATFTDWGVNAIDVYRKNGSVWSAYSGVLYTLSHDEWWYLLHTRKNATNLCGGVTLMVEGGSGYQRGYVLLPDLWEAPAGITFIPKGNNVYYKDDEWQKMEESGAVFLPLSGQRYVNSNTGAMMYQDEYKNGYYWTSTKGNSTSAYCMVFRVSDETSSTGVMDTRYSYGCSVRLVQDFITE